MRLDNKTIEFCLIIVATLFFIEEFLLKDYVFAVFWCIGGLISTFLYVYEKSNEDFWKHKGKKY